MGQQQARSGFGNKSPLPISPAPSTPPESPMGLEAEADKATSIHAPFKALIQRGLGEEGIFSKTKQKKSVAFCFGDV